MSEPAYTYEVMGNAEFTHVWIRQDGKYVATLKPELALAVLKPEIAQAVRDAIDNRGKKPA